MNEIKALILPLLSGAVLGVFFFVGLWWTIRFGLRSSVPALWFLGSLLSRVTVVLGGIYFIGHKDWHQLIACLLGFWLARIWVLRSHHKHVPSANSQLTRAEP